MELLQCFIIALAITALTASCQKDDFEESVLPQTAQGTSGQNGHEGTSGAGGTVGVNGENGDDGVDGEDGAQGEPGTDGQDGADGTQGEQGEPGPAGENGTPGPKGDQGDTGPAGPKGDTGATGADGRDGADGTNGVDGTNGTDGEDGNANVIASDWFGPDRQTFVVNGYTKYAEFNRKISNLDAEIYEKGTLLVYAQFSNFVPEVWPENYSAPLPLTISAGTTEHVYTYYFSTTHLRVRYRQEGPNDTWSFAPSSRFRYIAIPSNISAKGNVDFSKMTYDEVIHHFGLAL